MSDTDDTDDLLLIPPDLFLIQSDTEDHKNFYGPYYNVVDKLITQVNKLENRIDSIEASPSGSFMSSSLDYSVNANDYQTNLMSHSRRFNSWEDLPSSRDVYLGSTQSTPQKPRARIKLNSLPSTPSTDRHIPNKSPNKRLAFKAHHQLGDRLHIPSLPNREQHSYRSTSSGENKHEQNTQNEILCEIDHFITNVNTIKKYQVARNLNSEFDSFKLDGKSAGGTIESTKASKNINVNDVDNMLHAMESQQREMESRLKEKEHELKISRKSPETREEFIRERAWEQGDTKASVPDRGMGMRDILYDEQYKNVSLKDPIKENVVTRLTVTNVNSQVPSDISGRNSDSIYTDNSPSLSSSDSTQLTAYQNKDLHDITKDNKINPEFGKIHFTAMQVLNKHKDLLSQNSIKNSSIENPEHLWSKPSQKFDKSAAYNYQKELFIPKSTDHEISSSGRNQLALLSLSELWNQNSGIDRSRDHSKCLNKIQEEKLRRQHCEQLIRELQTRNLELQEKVAVAVRVDQAKDEAILQVHNSWEEAASTIDNVNKEKMQLEQQIDEIKNRVSIELSEAAKKVNHYEDEASKALNLAHNNQEKLVSLEKQNMYYEAELQSVQNKLTTIQSNYTAEMDKNQQLSKIISQKEIELNENKNILTEARKEVAQSKRAVELCQSELISIKNSQTQLETKFTEELERAKALELEKARLLNEIDTHKRIEKSLQDDLNKQKNLNEQNKVELRNFYQDQVEVVVRDKLREFQAQLEKAESSIQDEIRSRELAVAKAAAVHIQQVTEKHALEVHLLEEKHKEEVKLYKLQMSQTQQQIDNLHVKMHQQQESRSNIAHKLHKVMEAQWLEAMKIINNGKSPIISQDKSTNTIEQLNSLKSKSYSNLEEILLKEDSSSVRAGGDYAVLKASVPLLQSTNSISSVIDDDSYDKNIQMLTETPVTSRPQKSRQQMENELQKYIQMLLNRSPGNPVDEKNPKFEKHKIHSDNQHDNRFANSQCQQAANDKLNPDGTKSHKMSNRDRLGKPPWK